MEKRKGNVQDLFRDTPKYQNKKLKLTLPLPPSVNRMYTMRKQLTSESQRYIRDAKALINEAIDEQRWLCQDKCTWYYVDLIFYFPDRIRRDSHNMLKLLLDVMQGKVFDNDYYALPRIQAVEYDHNFPRVEVIVFPQTNNARDKGIALAR